MARTVVVAFLLYALNKSHSKCAHAKFEVLYPISYCNISKYISRLTTTCVTKPKYPSDYTDLLSVFGILSSEAYCMTLKLFSQKP